jgi:hypothetical protein
MIALTLYFVKIQDHFVLIVSEFLYIPWKFMKEQVAAQATIRDDTSCTPSVTIMAAENLEGQVIEHLRDKVTCFLRPGNTATVFLVFVKRGICG